MIKKTKELEEARKLRGEGVAIPEIAKRINVSKSSVSYWVRDIILTDEQKFKLKPSGNWFNGAKADKDKWLKIRKEFQNRGRELSKNKDIDFISGCMLYWAEGAKSQNALTFVNSDPNMAKFFLNFVRKFFNVRSDKIGISCNCYLDMGLTIEDIENYWLSILELPKDCLRKAYIDRRPKSSTKYGNRKSTYGTVRISIGDFSIVQTIYGAIQEYVGFENEKWLCNKRSSKTEIV